MKAFGSASRKAERIASISPQISFTIAQMKKWLIINTGQEGETSCPVGDWIGFKKLLKMVYILLEKGQYYDPNYAVKAAE